MIACPECGEPDHGPDDGKARVRIRSAIYRGERGYSVTGKSTRGQRVKVFAPTRAEAERVVTNIKAGRWAFDD